ncbi:DUF2188 domain-containing protein [Patescibacteria group bacterium]|nr:DUF2188 domain-containing protein [Patescibacteria group bacterium]MBU1885384.1 DUF2188 domain-containing protein [Patescibacteria group bacterium]
MKSQHVLPRDNSWIVKRAGASRATKIFNNQNQAKKFALDVAKNQGTALFIHGSDDRIRDRRYF